MNIQKNDECSLCGAKPPIGKHWLSESHVSFTFVWCDICNKNRRKECDELKNNILEKWKKRQTIKVPKVSRKKEMSFWQSLLYKIGIR